MSHEGEAHRAEPGVMTFGEPAEGEIFADRYQLQEHVDTDAARPMSAMSHGSISQRPPR